MIIIWQGTFVYFFLPMRIAFLNDANSIYGSEIDRVALKILI